MHARPGYAGGRTAVRLAGVSSRPWCKARAALYAASTLPGYIVTLVIDMWKLETEEDGAMGKDSTFKPRRQKPVGFDALDENLPGQPS